MVFSSKSFRVEYLYRPGRWLDDASLTKLASELTALGKLCLDPLPDYQVFLSTRLAFSDKILTIARSPDDNRLLAFCSCVLLPIPPLGDVLHLGLTCVHPSLRSSGLSNILARRLFSQYILTRRPLDRLWITSVACVLNVLGRLATNFANAYPSPWQTTPFAPEVNLIAQTFDSNFRHVAYVQPDAIFDWDTFVFRGSGRGTAFQKEANAKEFYHHNDVINAYFNRRLHFDDGDEMLQVATINLPQLLAFPLIRWWRLHHLPISQN